MASPHAAGVAALFASSIPGGIPAQWPQRCTAQRRHWRVHRTGSHSRLTTSALDALATHPTHPSLVTASSTRAPAAGAEQALSRALPRSWLTGVRTNRHGQRVRGRVRGAGGRQRWIRAVDLCPSLKAHIHDSSSSLKPILRDSSSAGRVVDHSCHHMEWRAPDPSPTGPRNRDQLRVVARSDIAVIQHSSAIRTVKP